MEIVLQWLDELDDLAASLALRWEMLRRRCLQLGLLAGLADAAAAGVGSPLGALAAVAALSVGLWSVALAGSLVLRLPRHARPA